jgi:hypothetical protein
LHLTPHRDERVDVTAARRELDALLLALDGAVVPLCAAGLLVGVGVVAGATSAALLLLCSD